MDESRASEEFKTLEESKIVGELRSRISLGLNAGAARPPGDDTCEKDSTALEELKTLEDSKMTEEFERSSWSLSGEAKDVKGSTSSNALDELRTLAESRTLEEVEIRDEATLLIRDVAVL